MSLNRLLLIFAGIICSLTAMGQNTVGLLSYDKNKSYDGYNLVYPHNQPNVYLLDNCGEVVHTWTDDEAWRPGNIAYLTKSGRLVKGKRHKNVTQDAIWFGGGGAIIEIRDWDNTLVWSFELNDSQQRLHHDFAPMPNGNILMTVWNKMTKQQLYEAGRDTIQYKDESLLSESIIEVNPATNEIVWKWELKNHFIQDRDSLRANYGKLADHPGKVNINYPTNTIQNSWFHINAIDYNEELDQIVVSVPTYNEIWILDHTTTTAQAASNSGGLSGTGGQLMYRWGNPATYGKGDIVPQSLFFQHDIHWLDNFIPATNPNYGKLAVFNNQAGTNFSTAEFFTTPWDMYEWKYTKTNGAWGPLASDRTIKHPVQTKMFSSGLSSVQLLPNNNVLILVGRTGYAFELDNNGQIVWEYIVPLKNGVSVSQGSSLVPNDNTTFRMKRYPADFEAFAGKDLSPKSYIESMPDTAYCTKLVSVNDTNHPGPLRLSPNPANSYLSLISRQAGPYEIFSAEGKCMLSSIISEGINQIDITALPAGMYYLKLATAPAAVLFIKSN